MGTGVVRELGPLLRRRDFLVRSGLLLGASSVAGAGGYVAAKKLSGEEDLAAAPAQGGRLSDWDDVHGLFARRKIEQQRAVRACMKSQSAGPERRRLIGG